MANSLRRTSTRVYQTTRASPGYEPPSEHDDGPVRKRRPSACSLSGLPTLIPITHTKHARPSLGRAVLTKQGVAAPAPPESPWLVTVVSAHSLSYCSATADRPMSALPSDVDLRRILSSCIPRMCVPGGAAYIHEQTGCNGLPSSCHH